MTNKNDHNPPPIKTGKNIIICLDGTNNQFGGDLSNIIKLFRMLEREPGKQVTYYDPGVGTMGDPAYKTAIARVINKMMGLAFGRGLMKNLVEAYIFLMKEYEDGDKVFLFGFSRGAYTARALAAFIKECGLLERGAQNLIPYMKRNFLEKAPKKLIEEDEEAEEAISKFHSKRSGFRKIYGRLLNRKKDPLTGKKNKPNYQLRIHFLGLFDTVKSYGWITDPVILRSETVNPSVLNTRHALAIDEKRKFFHQLHWKASKGSQTCKEVWFAGDHSDIGGGHPERESGLAKIALKWMVHEAMMLGMLVVPERYGLELQKEQDEQNNWIPKLVKEENKGKYTGPNAFGMLHESPAGPWKIAQVIPNKLEDWEENSKNMRMIKSEQERLDTKEERNPFLVHKTVIDRILNKEEIKYKDKLIQYEPQNLKSFIIKMLNKDTKVDAGNDFKDLKSLINDLPKKCIVETTSANQVFNYKIVNGEE